MGKLTLSEYEAMDRIKVDTLISLLIDKNIINKNEVKTIMNNEIDNLVDCSSKEKIRLELNKFLNKL